jgi:glycolate oxidase iron-sulfur subunit
MTTCPSGVHYMHLVDHARAHIEKTYERPWPTAAARALAASCPIRPLPRSRCSGARSAAVCAARAHPRIGAPGAMLDLAPRRPPALAACGGRGHPAEGAARKGRVALLTGCAQTVLGPGINDATIRLLTAIGVEVVVPEGEGCCGALVHHMGREARGAALRAAQHRRLDRRDRGRGLDAIVITASGCGTTIKDYGFMLRLDPAYAEKAARSRRWRATSPNPGDPAARPEARAAPARRLSLRLLDAARPADPRGAEGAAGEGRLQVVKDVPEGHICCGSAGTYNILQPEIAAQLRARKVANIERTGPTSSPPAISAA